VHKVFDHKKSVYSIAWNCVLPVLCENDFIVILLSQPIHRSVSKKTIQNTSRGILPSGANPDKDPTVTWKYCLM